jgi:hypothetical protein
MAEELYEYDEASGHLFCKYCGRNYLAKKHNEGCQSINHELPKQSKDSD